MARRSPLVSILVAVTLLSAAPTATTADDAPSAMLGGRSIDRSSVAGLHCHDLDHPVIRCFRSEARLTRAVRWSIALAGGPAGTRLAAVPYVRIFEHASFNGASMYLSASYADLSVIGWNDRITSFKPLNGGSGTFWHHAGQEGTAHAFCCATNVANVGSAHNDRFSSVAGSA
jgi:hypothetical protein